MLTPDGKKTCGLCRESKPAEADFYRVTRKGGDGYHGYCKACLKQKAVQWQKANPEKKAASDFKQRMKRPSFGRPQHAPIIHDTPEKLKAAQARASRKWRDRMRADPVRHAAHLAKMREKWHRDPRVKAARNLTRRLCGSGPSIKPSDPLVQHWLSLLVVFRGCCAYCHAECPSPEIDHIVAVAAGGLTEIGNLLPACRGCNSEKKKKALEEFAAWKGTFDPNEVRRLAATADSAMLAAA